MIFALYLTRVFLLSSGTAFLALGVLAELLDLLDNGNTVIAQHGRLDDLAYYAALITPTIAASVMPIATLVGGLVTFGNLAGNNEIVAMRSSGMTLYWVVSHLAPAALLIGLLYFGLRFIVAPYTEIQVYEMLREHPTEDAAAGRNTESGAPAAGAYWIGSGPLLLAFETVENEGRVIRNITLFSRDENARMVQHLRANTGAFGKDGWRFDGVSSQKIGVSGGNRNAGDTFVLSDGPQPIDILAATIPNARVRLSAPGIGAANIWAGGNSPATRQTNFYEATAAPFVPLIMLLAAAPLALGTARHPSQARDMGIALCAGFGYLLASGVFRSLGESGVMPALLAVWGPVIIFALAAASILAHREG